MAHSNVIDPDRMRSVRVRIPEHVVHRSFVAETVVLNLSTGKYHGLNPTAGRMLESLERTGSVAESARLLSEDFGVPVERVTEDLAVLCDQLSSRGLIETSFGD